MSSPEPLKTHEDQVVEGMFGCLAGLILLALFISFVINVIG